MTNHGTAVNLYQISKMLGGRDDVMNIKMMLYNSFPQDKRYYREYRHMTFDEYINAKRNFIANVMGYHEYL